MTQPAFAKIIVMQPGIYKGSTGNSEVNINYMLIGLASGSPLCKLTGKYIWVFTPGFRETAPLFSALRGISARAVRHGGYAPADSQLPVLAEKP